MTFAQLIARIGPEQIAELKLWLMPRLVGVVEGNVKRVTPVRTGTLRRSINSRVEAAGERGVIATSVHYAPYVHKHQPFMTDGLEASRAAINDLLQQAGDRFTEGAAGG